MPKTKAASLWEENGITETAEAVIVLPPVHVKELN